MATISTAPLEAVPGVLIRAEHVRARSRPWFGRLARTQPWLAVPCAVVLLLYPNPLVPLAAVAGAAPLMARWVAVGRPWPRSLLDLPLALFLAGALLGATAGLNSEAIALRLSGLVAGLFLYAALVTRVRSPRQFRAVTLAFLVLSVVAAFALVNIVAPFLHLDRAPALQEIAQALDLGGLTQGLSDEEALLKRYRLRPSGVGALADIGLALTVVAAIGLRAPWQRALLILPGLLFCSVLLVTDSRASMLAGAIALATLAAFWRPRLTPLIPIGVAMILLLFEWGIVTKGTNLRTLGQRFWFWENSLYLAQEYPITGVGLGTQSVQLTYRTYFLPVFPIFSHAHNIYLQALLEQGVLGLVGLAGLTIGAFWLAWRARRAENRWTRLGGLAGLGMALALFVTGLGEITALSPIGSALLLASLGLLAAAAAAAPKHAKARPASAAPLRFGRRNRWTLLTGCILALAILMVSTGWSSRLASAALLNFGSIELNRALVSEETTRQERGRFLDQSIWLLRTAGRLDESDPGVQRNLAIALAAKDDNRGARAAADRARSQTDPADQRGQFQLGRAYVAVGHWSEAISAWGAAESGPQVLQLANRLVRSRNWDQAIAAFRVAAMLHPESRGAYEGIARAARFSGDGPEQVAKHFGPILALGGENEYLGRLELSRYFREQNSPLRALEEVRLAGKIREDAAHSQEEGAVFVQLGRFAEAEPLLTRALVDITEQLGQLRDDPLRPNRSPHFLSSDELDSFYWLAVVQARTGKHLTAMQTARQALEHVEPSRRAQRSPFLALIGDSLSIIGQTRDALATYEQGMPITPDDLHLADSVARARAVMEGGPMNLMANGGFEWDGGWRLVPETDPGASLLGAPDSSGVGKRVGRITAGLDGTRYTAQQVSGLTPGRAYRLFANVRTENLEDGAAVMRVLGRVPSRSGEGFTVAALARTESRSPEWRTIELSFTAPGPSVSVELGFPEGVSRGASASFDEVTLMAQ